ncbi:MAG: DUF2207 domain-containing protein [Woeseiaceae bacterium]|nr:DUF2207 domain-containing protein [Woeseiaceae bacterium]
MIRLLALLLPLVLQAAAADERILDYHSDIVVQADGTVDVTETIRVRAEGRQIRRGIYRDYPTRYRDRYGNEVVAGYEPVSEQRDGRPEPFHTERIGNGVRTYFGSADVRLEPGTYTYRYRYSTERMIGFFEEYDELYWNVTGLGWAFPIDNASATVGFGFDVAAAELDVVAFTGGYGERGSDFRARTADGQAHVEATRTLQPAEGLTIAVSWPKGLVAEPDGTARLIWLLRDNSNLLFALAGLLTILMYYVPVWRHFGKDPAAGVQLTRYEPPAGFSPASLRYIRRMGYDNKVFTAAVVNLAVKGYLAIEEQDDEYTLRRQPGEAGLPALANGERELLEALFADSDSVRLDDKNHRVMSAAREAHRNSLRRDYRNRMFRTNALMNLPPILLFLLTIVLAFHGGGATPFVFVVLGITVAVMGVFAWLMKVPTAVGRKLLDEADGFVEYLEIAEKDELNLRNPPDKTPQLFERYLPFALALGVEQAWTERFSSVFARLQGADGAPYHPAWYHGSSSGFDFSSRAAGLGGSLDSAISSSMSPPGSSSGSGGGFSGGGGGGGGGGGW